MGWSKLGDSGLFPACAGMNRQKPPSPCGSPPVPRMRGDEPATKERLADQDYPAALDRKLGLIVVLHTNGR